MMIMYNTIGEVLEIAEDIQETENGFKVTKNGYISTLLCSPDDIATINLASVDSVPEPTEPNGTLVYIDNILSYVYKEHTPEEQIETLKKANDDLRVKMETTAAAVDFILMNFMPM